GCGPAAPRGGPLLGDGGVTESEPLDGDAEVAREPGHIGERRGPSPKPPVEVLGRVAALLAEAPDIWAIVLPVAKPTKAQPDPSRHPLNLTHGFSGGGGTDQAAPDRKSTRLNSSHRTI